MPEGDDRVTFEEFRNSDTSSSIFRKQLKQNFDNIEEQKEEDIKLEDILDFQQTLETGRLSYSLSKNGLNVEYIQQGGPTLESLTINIRKKLTGKTKSLEDDRGYIVDVIVVHREQGREFYEGNS